MYRIEVSPGEETVFRTIEELATAIRNGLVTPRSRIYHNASQKWLPIEFHPHYKKALGICDRPRPVPAAPAAAVQPPAPVTLFEPPPPPIPAAPGATAPARPVTPARSAGFLLPPVVASLPLIEVELPEIPRPEALPASTARAAPAVTHGSSAPPSPAPAGLPVARRRQSGGRPLLYAGSAVTLVVAGYFMTTAVPSGGVAAAAAVPSIAAEAISRVAKAIPAVAEENLESEILREPEPMPAPVASPADQPEREAAAPVAPRPLPAAAPVITSVAPRRGPPSQAWSSSAGAIAPPPVPAPAPPSAATPAAAIAPPPAELDLSAASLQVADSLTPKANAPRDTGAIGRILRAVGATKASQTKPAE